MTHPIPILALILAVVATAPHAAHGQIVCRSARNLSVTSDPGCSAVTFSWTGARLGNLWRVYRNDLPSLSGAIVLGSFENPPVIDPSGDEGKTYYYWVQDVGGVCGTNSPVIGPASGMTARPAAPTGVSAADGTDCDTLQVQWNAVPGAVSYDVLRGATTIFSNAVFLANTTETHFADATADPRYAHWYWVRARGVNNCTGPVQSILESGSLVTPFLPDLVLHPDARNSYQFATFEDGRHALFVVNAVANIGNSRLLVFPMNGMPDGTEEFFQRTVECGRTVDRSLGRFRTPTVEWAPPNTFPHFVRNRLRHRLPDGSAGQEVARLDLPGACLFDYAEYDTTLAGAPNTPQFQSCETIQRGISIGWATVAPPFAISFAMDLDCVPNGNYYLEREIDPENRIYEVDETNNFERIPITIDIVPTATGPIVSGTPCHQPNMRARLLGPDSLIVATGAPTDSLTVTVWAGDRTEPEGPPDFPGFAEIGYLATNAAGRSGEPSGWVFAPAQWRRQNGSDDVFAATLTIPEPGEYWYVFRFRDDDGLYLTADRDGTENGFSIEQAGLIRVQDTTSAGVGEHWGALDFAVRSNPARGTTHFAIALPEAATPRVTIYDVAGRRVRSIDTGALAAGPHLLEWDGRRDDGTRARAGIYLAQLETGAGDRLVAKWVFTP